MLWPYGRFTELYGFLVDNYLCVTECVYKFDHYLELAFYRFFAVRNFFCGRGTSICALPETGEPKEHREEAILLFAQDLFPNAFIEFKQLVVTCMENYNKESYVPSALNSRAKLENSVAKVCDIVCFPLKPKPHKLLTYALEADMADAVRCVCEGDVAVNDCEVAAELCGELATLLFETWTVS
jgi:hypothetical protein